MNAEMNAATTRQNRRKTLMGVVVSDKMQKTITVKVETKSSHPLYGKRFTAHKKYHAHDEKEEANVGDRVQITECRPLSATKRWRLVSVLEKAK